MSTLEYTIYGLKRGFRVSRTFAFCGAFAALLVNGFFAGATVPGVSRITTILMFSLLAFIFGIKAKKRFSGFPMTSNVSARTELELGLMLLLATHAGIEIAGGLASPYYPSLLILVAFLVVYTTQWIGLTLVAAAILLEFAIAQANPSDEMYWHVMLHAIFIALFSLINLVFTRTEVARMRFRAMKKIEQVKKQMLNDAKTFRLTAATSEVLRAATRQEEEERLSRSTVTEVRRTMFHHVNLLKQTLDLHTCILFWRLSDVRFVKILECVSDCDDIQRRDFARTEGIVGAVFQSGKIMVQKNLKIGHSSLVYYSNNPGVTDFLGMPIYEGSNVSGVLCADRKDNKSFTPKDKEILQSAIDSIVQTVSNERVFVQLQQAKSEQGRLLKASDALSKVLNTSDVLEAALDSCLLIAPFDMATVAVSSESNKQKILAARGENIELLKDLEFSMRSGLVSSVCRTGHYLPYKGKFDYKQQVVYTRSSQKAFEKMQSLIVLPLLCGEETLGTLMLASKQSGAYTEQIRTTLQVMINQLGTKLQNAQMVKRLEEMATTDGLTGLPNHRSFQEELNRQLAHSNRYGTTTSIILCDVDKFKDVNDTYGHTVGDVVLKALGATLKRIVVRDTDMPARYGGEEFVIICGGTDTEGAVKLAQRVRQDLESQVFNTEKGGLICTISMGVATFPIHARKKEELIERADMALYAAKEGGRNQVKVWEKNMQI